MVFRDFGFEILKKLVDNAVSYDLLFWNIYLSKQCCHWQYQQADASVTKGNF